MRARSASRIPSVRLVGFHASGDRVERVSGPRSQDAAIGIRFVPRALLNAAIMKPLGDMNQLTRGRCSRSWMGDRLSICVPTSDLRRPFTFAPYKLRNAPCHSNALQTLGESPPFGCWVAVGFTLMRAEIHRRMRNESTVQQASMPPPRAMRHPTSFSSWRMTWVGGT